LIFFFISSIIPIFNYNAHFSSDIVDFILVHLFNLIINVSLNSYNINLFLNSES
jgi:hypothetical protein